MKKVLLFLSPVVLACLVFGAVLLFIQKQNTGKGALQVTSLPQSSVYLDGKNIGKTPLCKCDQGSMLPIGDYTIRLVPETGNIPPYEDAVHIYPSVLSVVDRTFGDIGKSSGSIIDLKPIENSKMGQLFVQSIPEEADVTIDSNPSGKTPLLIQSITDSDHEVTLTKQGFAAKTIRIHTVTGYKLSITAYLATDLSVQSASTSAPVAPSLAVTPTPTGPQALILDTPTGFLRVRTEASLDGSESGKVNPGQTFPILDTQDGWYKIQLPDGTSGWISASYAKKQ